MKPGTVTVTFGGYCLNDRFNVLCDSRPLPEWRDLSTTVDGADGDEFDGLTVGPRTATVTLLALDETPKGLHLAARELMQALNKRTPTALTFSDEVDKDGNQLTRYAVPSGAFDFEEFQRSGKWTVTFKSHDPYLRGVKRSAVVKSASPLVIDAGGNAKAWPKVTAVPGAGSTWTIQGDKTLTYKASFDGSKKLVLDMAAQTATTTASGTGLTLGSRFFGLEGKQTVSVSSGTATLEWEELFL